MCPNATDQEFSDCSAAHHPGDNHPGGVMRGGRGRWERETRLSDQVVEKLEATLTLGR